MAREERKIQRRRTAHNGSATGKVNAMPEQKAKTSSAVTPDCSPAAACRPQLRYLFAGGQIDQHDAAVDYHVLVGPDRLDFDHDGSRHRPSPPEFQALR
jgi:hypothetical protein